MPSQDSSQISGWMSHVSLPLEILSGFKLPIYPSRPPVRLPRGAGTTYLLPSANAVLEPARDLSETNIICNILSQLPSEDVAFRTSQPLKSTVGSFTYHGWSASLYIPHVRSLDKSKGGYTVDRLQEIISVSATFHVALNKVKLSNAEIDHLKYGRHHVWAHSHRAVWSHETDPQTILSPFAPEIATDRTHPYTKLVQRLINLKGRLGDAALNNEQLYRESPQIIHGDTAGGDNILFASLPSSDEFGGPLEPLPTTKPPVVIDLSPTIGPSIYAEGIILADALIWCGTDVEILDFATNQTLPQTLDILRRGLMFRCLSDIGLVARGHEAAKPDILQIERCTGLLEQWIAEKTVS